MAAVVASQNINSSPSKSSERLIDGRKTPDFEFYSQIFPPELARQIMMGKLCKFMLIWNLMPLLANAGKIMYSYSFDKIAANSSNVSWNVCNSLSYPRISFLRYFHSHMNLFWCIVQFHMEFFCMLYMSSCSWPALSKKCDLLLNNDLDPISHSLPSYPL